MSVFTNVIYDWCTWNLPYFLIQPNVPFIIYFILIIKCYEHLCNFYGNFAINVLINAYHPNCLVYKNTIPHLLTVAGLATAKS